MAKTNKKQLITWTLALLIIASFCLIDYSSLSSLTGEYVTSIIQGLFKPDWSFVYDGSGEDLVGLMLVTVAIAFYGTICGTILAIPFIFLASDLVWGKYNWVAKIGRGILNILRSVPNIIYAIIFVRIVGPGPFAGALAIAVQNVGMLGKLISEEIDNVDLGPIEAIDSSGGTKLQAFWYAVIPQVMPIAVTHILNHFEIAVRSATILGLVGAGGIGAPVIFALQSRNWSRVSIILLGIILVVLVIDWLSAKIRQALQ